MQIIGNDETVARHSGINTARLKIILFMISGAFIGMAGAILAPRYAYVEPPSAFNPMISFLVVIMALLGGTRRLWGPLVGVIPFTIVMDFVSVRFPNDTSIVIGIAFLVIVYLLPDGVTGRLEQLLARIAAAAFARRARGREGARMTAVALSVSGARKAFGGLVAVNDVSFDVHEGELFGLIGPNGSGKTTMLNLISGALKPDCRRDQACRRTRSAGLPAHQIARRGVARTFQLVRMLPSMDAERNVMAGAVFGHQRLWGAPARDLARELLALVGSARPRACAGRRHDLYRPEACRTGARARLRSARAAARRMAGRPQSE